MKTAFAAPALTSRGAVLVVVLLLFASVLAYENSVRDPLASAETRFVEYSASGLQIVPASCPSDPHTSVDECNGGGENPGNGWCTINANPWSIQPGESSTLSWNVTIGGDTGGIIEPSNVTLTNFGSVPRTGTEVTGPLQQSTTYTLSGNYALFSLIQLFSFECSTTVQVDTQCTPTYSCYVPPGGGVSTGIQNSCTGSVTQCQPGLVCQNAQCVCPSGASPGPFGCDQSSCPVGQHLVGSQCLCDATNELPVGGQCRSCTEYYYCSGDDRRVNNSCTGDRRVETCDYVCAGGSCIAFPPPSGDIDAHPSLVRSGRTSDIEWETEHTTSCAVTENNPEINDSWTGRFGEETSSPLEQQTIYTLRCVGRDGSEFVDTATVNIIPIWEEQ